MKPEFDTILKGRKFKKMLEQCFNEVRIQYGLKQIEVEILLFLDLYPQAHAVDMHRSLDLNKGHVSQALDSLQKKELICSKPDVNDRRSVCYECTPKGGKIICACRKQEEILSHDLLEGITDNELEIMTEVAVKIGRNIDRIRTFR